MIMKWKGLLIGLIFCQWGFAQISVDASGTFLTEGGKPFFWLADTGWELFHRLSREEAVEYLDVRQKQGFNVVMAVALAELDGIRRPNYYGDKPFKNVEDLEWDVTPGNDPEDSLQYDYWDHVDFIIEEAQKRDIYIGLLPAWGDKVVSDGAGPVLFRDSAESCSYARKLAERYGLRQNIIWILGGDRHAVGQVDRDGVMVTEDHRPVWRGMARAIRDVCGEDVFITYHPRWRTTDYFTGEDDWLRMNAAQSGHGSRDVKIWDIAREDRAKEPQLPFMDMEPCYEDHPVNPWDGEWTPEERGYFSAYDVRARIYRGVFAGGCGVVYGHRDVWQFTDTSRNRPVLPAGDFSYWGTAVHAAGATQMHHLKDLMLSFPDFHRVEDSLLITSDRGTDYRDKIIATRNPDKTYALVYLPQPFPVEIDFDRMGEGIKRIAWFNPVNGERTDMEKSYTAGKHSLIPPDTSQQDWVLIISKM